MRGFKTTGVFVDINNPLFDHIRRNPKHHHLCYATLTQIVIVVIMIIDWRHE